MIWCVVFVFLQQQIVGLFGKIIVIVMIVFLCGFVVCMMFELFLLIGVCLWGCMMVGVCCVGEWLWIVYLQVKVVVQVIYYVVVCQIVFGELFFVVDLVVCDGDLMVLLLVVIIDLVQVIGVIVFVCILVGLLLWQDMLKSVVLVLVGQMVWVVVVGFGFMILVEGSVFVNVVFGQLVWVWMVVGQIVMVIVKDVGIVEILLQGWICCKNVKNCLFGVFWVCDVKVWVDLVVIWVKLYRKFIVKIDFILKLSFFVLIGNGVVCVLFGMVQLFVQVGDVGLIGGDMIVNLLGLFGQLCLVFVLGDVDIDMGLVQLIKDVLNNGMLMIDVNKIVDGVLNIVCELFQQQCLGS